MLIDFYLENLTQKKVMQLPITPENYEIEENEQIETVKLASIGDINIPTYYEPKNISISGVFSTNPNNYLNKNWCPDIIRRTVDYVNVINSWKRKHDVIRVLIVPRGTIESRLDAKFYIKSLKIDGENEATGDISYTIEFVEYGDVKVKKLSNSNSKPSRSTIKPTPKKNAKKARYYTVKKGDCLWNIARKFYGNGALYTKILNANKSKIKNKNLIYSGQVFVIPY